MTGPRRVLVTGSRRWGKAAAVHEALDEQAELAADEGRGLLVVHGQCARGADAIADAHATARGWQVERHPADWETCTQACDHEPKTRDGVPYCPAAGPRRNAEMVAAGADVVLAFLRPGSSGTAGTIRMAKDAGLLVLLYTTL